MTPTPTAAGLPVKEATILAVLHRVGGATAADIAQQAGLGYSTTTPKLRALERAGLAERTKPEDGPHRWRLTDTGREHVIAVEPSDTPDSTTVAAPATDIDAPDTCATAGQKSAGPEHITVAAPHDDTAEPVSGDAPSADTAPDNASGGDAHAEAANPAGRRGAGTLRGAILDIL
ncbi:MAG: MarR family winged helix-turn-helix transcriptional regulator, partial [Actinocatenispora sp.]